MYLRAETTGGSKTRPCGAESGVAAGPCQHWVSGPANGCVLTRGTQREAPRSQVGEHPLETLNPEPCCMPSSKRAQSRSQHAELKESPLAVPAPGPPHRFASATTEKMITPAVAPVMEKA